MTTPTIETKISQAIQARVATCLPAYPKVWTDGEPVALPTAGGQPAPYIECHHEPNRTVRYLLDPKGKHGRPGILRMTLCWPLARVGTSSGKTHPNAVKEIAGDIATHFWPDNCMAFLGVTVSITKAPDVLGAYRDDTYLRVPVRIDCQTYA